MIDDDHRSVVQNGGVNSSSGEEGGILDANPLPSKHFIETKKAQECLCILGLWTNDLWLIQELPGQRKLLHMSFGANQIVLVGVTSHYKWMV